MNFVSPPHGSSSFTLPMRVSLSNLDSSSSSSSSFLMFTFLLTILPFLLTHQVTGADLYPQPRPKCEEINVPMCRGIGYNMTSMPNQFHHEKQDEAGMEAHQFWPLVEINCSEDLRLFLCSMYTPICMEDYHERLPVCRSVCERAQSGCAAIMLQYGFPWPDSMDCGNFPPYGSQDQLCMDQKEGASPAVPVSPPLLPTGPLSPSIFPPLKSSPPSSASPKPPLLTLDSNGSLLNIAGCNCHCRSPLVIIESNGHKRRVKTAGVPNCGYACHSNPFFTRQEQPQPILFITIAAVLCLICSLLVVCTYFTDRSRYDYPERAIILLSACYIMVSLGFLFRHHFGHSVVACQGDRIHYPETGVKSFHCITVFFLIYFFGMAASLWWVNLTLAWFLAASLKWSTEAIGSHSWIFHLIAWGIASVQSLLAVIYSAIDAEPLAGICSVGNLNPSNLKHFVILPLCAYLVIGSTFLLLGLLSLIQIRRVLRKHIRQVTDKTGLVKLMVRIIIFSSLYIVPTIVVIICNWYLYVNVPIWEATYACPCDTNTTLETPYVTIHMLKYVMTLMVGITTFFWILSWKTMKSWWLCTTRRLCCCSSKEEEPLPRDPLMGSTGGGSSQYIVNSQRSYKQINQIAQSSVSVGQSHRKI